MITYQTTMPESVREAWLGQTKTVAKSRPALFKIEGYLKDGPGKVRVHVGWFELGGRTWRASAEVEQGGDWQAALADALENEYQRAVELLTL